MVAPNTTPDRSEKRDRSAFSYEALPIRVIFGRGTIGRLSEAARDIGAGRILVLSTQQQEKSAADISRLLDGMVVARFAGAAMHTPIEVTEHVTDLARKVDADCIVSVGGGSTIGLGKAVVLRTGILHIALPTTYAGSEMTPILGETDAGVKTTIRDPKLVPDLVIYDVGLTLGLPVPLAATSALNAIAHAVEALYAREGNPVTALMAEDAIRALGSALPAIVSDPDDAEARSEALYGAWLCGICLGTAGMALHHKICHTLGGSFGLDHSRCHAVMLPYVTAYNADAAPRAMSRIAKALGSDTAHGGLRALARRIGAPLSLAEIGFSLDDVEHAASLAVANPYWNPRPIEKGAILDLLRRACLGEEP